MKNTIYDHYITIDWTAKNMDIARMTQKSKKEKKGQANKKEKKGQANYTMLTNYIAHHRFGSQTLAN